MRHTALAIALGIAASLTAAPSDYTVRALDRKWKRIEQLRPRMGVRELFGFALEAVGNDRWPERVEQALAWAESMQQRDPEQRKYGNFKWYWQDEGPADSNAVEFAMQQASLIWMFYKERLTPKAIEVLDRLIRFSVDGIRGHRVGESYTNIFVMKT